MAENPLTTIQKLDPELFQAVEAGRKLSLSEGALPAKTKSLIAMALDPPNGTEEGTANLARAALHAGATKEEIAETIRVAHFICGAGAVYTAAHALKDIV